MGINLNQNKTHLKNRYGGAENIIDKVLGIGELDYRLNSPANMIEIGECYDYFKVDNNVIKDDYNICVTEINPVKDDYIIKGIGMNDEKIIVKLSETEFWSQ